MPFCAAASSIEVPGGQLILLSSIVKTMFSKRLTPFFKGWPVGPLTRYPYGLFKI
jgi:hypothetical protein